MVYRTGAQGTLDRPTIRRACAGSTTVGGSPQQLRYNSPRTFPVGRERTHTSLTGRRVVVPTRRGGRKRASRPSPSPTQQSRSAAGGRPLAPTPRPSWPVVCVARSWAKNAAVGPRPVGGAFPGNGPTDFWLTGSAPPRCCGQSAAFFLLRPFRRVPVVVRLLPAARGRLPRRRKEAVRLLPVVPAFRCT